MLSCTQLAYCSLGVDVPISVLKESREDLHYTIANIFQSFQRNARGPVRHTHAGERVPAQYVGAT